MSLSPSQKNTTPKQILHILKNYIADLSLVKEKIPGGFDHLYWSSHYIACIVHTDSLPIDRPWHEAFGGGIRTDRSPEWFMFPLSEQKDDGTREFGLAWRVPFMPLVAFYLAPAGLPDLIASEAGKKGVLTEGGETWREWMKNTGGGFDEEVAEENNHIFLLQGLLDIDYNIGHKSIRPGRFGTKEGKGERVPLDVRKSFSSKYHLPREHLEKVIQSAAILYHHQTHVRRGGAGSTDTNILA